MDQQAESQKWNMIFKFAVLGVIILGMCIGATLIYTNRPKSTPINQSNIKTTPKPTRKIVPTIDMQAEQQEDYIECYNTGVEALIKDNPQATIDQFQAGVDFVKDYCSTQYPLAKP